MPNNFLDELAADEAPRNNFLAELAADQEKQAPVPVQEEKLPWWKTAMKDMTDTEGWKRSLGLVARGAIQGVQAPLTIPADFGIAVRNVITGEQNESLSSMRDRNLDELGFPSPQTKMEKAGTFVASVVGGMGMPAPTIKNPAPANFVKPSASPSEAVLKEARDAGYVVPPATAKPNVINKAVESVGGKIATAQNASIRNQTLTNELARKALKLTTGEPITPDALKGIREAAGKVYEQIADSGTIVADAQYLDDLATLGKSADEIAKAFPGANVGATKQISELTDSLLQDKFDAKAALQYLRELRKSANSNLSGMNVADPAKSALGMAQREAASTLEDLIGRHLSANGMEEIAQSFGEARKMIAISHTVEKALNESTGNVVAGKLGQALAKGKPLSGELELVAKFARAFPKAAKEVTESMPGASPLDWYASGGVSALTGNPAALGWPFVRIGAQKLALSPLMQKGVKVPNIPVPPGVAPSLLMQTYREQE